MSKDEIIKLVASAENNSEHFLDKAIVEYAREQAVSIKETSHFYSETGRGIAAEIDGKKLLLGNKAWMDEQHIEVSGLIAAAGDFAG